MSKVVERAELGISYRALITRLHRAKESTGEQRILIEDTNGNPLTIEVREIE